MRMLAVALMMFSAQLTLAASTVNECRRFFNYPDGTDELMSYVQSISSLPQLQADLIAFYSFLARGEIKNPISKLLGRVDAEMQIHRNGFNTILKQSSFDLNRLKIWASERLATTTSERQSRTDIEAITKLTVRPLKLAQVHDPKLKNDPTEPAYELFMMDGPVTQAMWLDVFGFNPSQNQKRDEIDSPANLPVENINFMSAVVFANIMSKKMGLPEAYDLSDIMFKSAKNKAEIIKLAGEGKLEIVGEANEKLFVQRNTSEKVVASQGLRLPTPTELTFLFQQARFYGLPVADLSEQQLSSLVDFGDETHTVGTLPVAAIINNHQIHDLVGNVTFWTTPASMMRLSGSIEFSSFVWGQSFATIEVPQDIKKSSAIPFYCRVSNYTKGIILVRTVQP